MKYLNRQSCRRVWWAIALWCGVGVAQAGAQAPDDTIVQGRLSLHWGDAVQTPGSHEAKPAKLRATLLTDDGRRIALQPDQAQRAAVDLYRLGNRRVAVSLPKQAGAQAGRVTSASRAYGAGGREPEQAVDAIVPAESVPGTAPAPSGGKVTAAAVAAAAGVQGTTRWISVMCKYKDIATEQRDLAFFNSQYGTAVTQLGHFWGEVSYGQINLAGSAAYGWFTLPMPRSTYVTNVNGEDEVDLDLLFQDCVSAADAQVDFSGVQGINLMFNGELDGRAWGGNSCAVMDGAKRCLRVTWNPPWSFKNLAHIAHEMGHGYGLPHSNNSDGDSATSDNPWDLMSDSSRNAVTDATYGTLPKHINIVQRDRLGWIPAARRRVIAANTRGSWQFELEYASSVDATGNQIVVLQMPAQTDPAKTIFYTLEARRRVGAYEAKLAGDAVIVHRVKNGIAYSEDADVPPADISNNEGSMFKPGETWSNPDGSYRVRVDAMTTRGFLITVFAGGRAVGGVVAPLQGTGTASAAMVSAGSVPVSAAAPVKSNAVSVNGRVPLPARPAYQIDRPAR